MRVQELGKVYGPVEALTAATLNVQAGEVFGLLGPNGAGKTTLISILSTHRRPSTGDALVLGRSVRTQLRAVRQMIGIAPQEIALYPTLTAAENLRFFGRIYGLPCVQLAARVEQLLGFVGLQDRANDRVETYSGGMKRRLNLAAALVHRPKLLLLDEPTAGVDPHSREDILNLVGRLRRDGTAVLYTTQQMEEAERICDRIGIMNHGRLVAMGTLDELLRNLECSEVIELRGLSTSTDVEQFRAMAGVCALEHRDGIVRLFVKRATDLLQPLHAVVSREKSARLTICPVSLETLFLRVTGEPRTL